MNHGGTETRSKETAPQERREEERPFLRARSRATLLLRGSVPPWFTTSYFFPLPRSLFTSLLSATPAL
jgi:hypothetical protein